MITLSPAQAYRLWAPSYADETSVSDLDQRLIRTLSPDAGGRRLLDAGCGTGRRLRETMGARLAIGVDLVPAMLVRARAPLCLAAGDVRALPFADETFDLVWCRLVVGHIPQLTPAYAELARVCRPGGAIVVTDFHPAAARAGHRRTFHARTGQTIAVVHHVHDVESHGRAACAFGLDLVQVREECVGPAIRAYYLASGRLDRYAADVGLPLVLGLLWRRPAASGPKT